MSERLGFAHRGGGHGPDNALETFEAALALGARGLESDAWLSLDGAVVLDHDGFADPARRQPIAQVRRDELPAHLATLDDLYERCGTDFDLAVDVKTEAVADALVATAARHQAADRLWVVVGATSAQVLVRLDAGHRVMTIRGNVLRSPRRTKVLEMAKTLGVEAVNGRWPWWDRTIARQVHDLGLLAFGYDAQWPWALDRSLAIGLDGVFSDHVDRMLAALARAVSR